MEIAINIKQGVEKAYKNDKGVAYAPWFATCKITYDGELRKRITFIFDTKEEATENIEKILSCIL